MNSDYSKGLAKSFTMALEAQGGVVVSAEKYRQKVHGLGAQLKKTKDIVCSGYPPELP
jgi:hypothetical protein